MASIFATLVVACYQRERSGACSGDYPQYAQERYSCEGTILVATALSCFAREPAQRITRDCSLEGKVCVVEGSSGAYATCAQPCDSDEGCAQDEYCADATEERPRSCARSLDRFYACDATKPRMCGAGLSCLVTHAPWAPSAETASCSTTCRTNNDCGKYGYCSGIALTATGEKVCAPPIGECDPTNEKSCVKPATCLPKKEGPDEDGGALPDETRTTYACK